MHAVQLVTARLKAVSRTRFLANSMVDKGAMGAVPAISALAVIADDQTQRTNQTISYLAHSSGASFEKVVAAMPSAQTIPFEKTLQSSATATTAEYERGLNLKHDPADPQPPNKSM